MTFCVAATPTTPTAATTMNLLKLVLTLAIMVALTEGRPRYLVVPMEDVRMVRQVRSLPRYQQALQRSSGGASRVAPVLPKVLPDLLEVEPHIPLASDLYERQSAGYSGNDHVDYGAYTGGYGAFGWYSDHPVCINCGYSHGGGYH